MNCPVCGVPNEEGSRFCAACGSGLVAETPPVKKKSSFRRHLKWLIPVVVLLALAVAAVVVYFNSSLYLAGKLEDTDWYTEPVSFVSVDSGEEALVGYVLTFDADGTAVRTTYLSYDTEADGNEMMAIKEEKLRWSFKGLNTLVLNGEEYAYGTDWGFEEDRLLLARTYYPENEWGYGEEKKEEMPAVDTSSQAPSDAVSITLVDEDGTLWLTNSHIAEVALSTQEDGSGSVYYCILFTLTEDGRDLMQEATEANIGKTLCIYADTDLLFAPTVNDVIEDGVFLLTCSSYEEASELFARLTGQVTE